MKRALVVGATSGIGLAVVRLLVANGWQVAASGRRMELLETLKELAPAQITILHCDVTDLEAARTHVMEATRILGGLDVVVVNAGVSSRNRLFAWEADLPVLETNIMGFSACAHAAMDVFLEQGYGHLLGIGSVAGQMSFARSAAYNASKAFVSNYLRGLRLRAMQRRKPVFVTDIRPGFINTPMTDGLKGKFWSVSAERAAELIVRAIRKPAKVVYVPGRWRVIAALSRYLPDWVLKNIF